jgi:murein DD-endopeptidase MepM/ murein hydrolase activator NlpD
LQWKTFQLYYEHDWTAVVDDGKGGTTLKSYSEEYTKNIRLLTSAACYDASYQYQWGQQVMERTSDTPGGGHDHSKVIIPQVTLLTRTGPYYQKLKTILSQPEYGLTSEMDMQMVIQCAQSLDQAYMIDSWLFGTPLEMSMDSENGTGLTSRFKFMPVNDAPVAVPYGMSYNQELNKLTMNPGVDLMADYGASVFSVADGTVVFTGAYGSDGNAIMINNGNCRTLYADLSITSVSVGQQVKAGQEIGKVGMPYLHFEVRTGNDMTEYLNPANYLPAMIWGTGSQVYVSPKALQYQAVNANVIIAFLQGKDSALANATAVNDIISGAQSHDINPLLLFAITGAEQSFDPVNGDTPSDVIMIADNPFNVGGTWQNGGYTLAQSADVCANFLAERLSQAPPSGTSAIEWINDPSNTSGGLYACGADGTPSPSWVPNVTGFFNMINGLAGVYSGTP